MCHFQDGSVCEEREFYRKKCNPQIEKHQEIANILDKEEDKTNNTKENTVCTMEAKECPDGSFVSRN
jgi:hypothetical protein